MQSQRFCLAHTGQIVQTLQGHLSRHVPQLMGSEETPMCSSALGNVNILFWSDVHFCITEGIASKLPLDTNVWVILHMYHRFCTCHLTTVSAGWEGWGRCWLRTLLGHHLCMQCCPSLVQGPSLSCSLTPPSCYLLNEWICEWQSGT
jgi:hypothetical protein